MKGTRLWQATGSPIIQGRSRTDRTFLAVWMPSVFIAVALVTALEAVISPPAAFDVAWLSAVAAGLLNSLWIVLVPTALAAWIGRHMRLDRLSLKAGVIGAAFAFAFNAFAGGWPF